MTSDTYQTRITELSALLKEGNCIDEEILELFYDIFYYDLGIFILFDKEMPFMELICGQGSYFRLFTQQELAEKSLKKYEDLTVKCLSTLELLQVARFGFSCGCNGFLLDDNNGITISCLSCLQLFYEKFLREPDKIEPKSVELILFIQNIRKNSVFHYGFYQKDDNTICILSEKDKKLTPINIPFLFQMKSDFKICITTINGFEILCSKGLLLAALKDCGVGKPPGYRPVTEYIDDQAELILGDWRVKELSVRLEPLENEEVELYTELAEKEKTVFDSQEEKFETIEEQQENAIRKQMVFLKSLQTIGHFFKNKICRKNKTRIENELQESILNHDRITSETAITKISLQNRIILNKKVLYMGTAVLIFCALCGQYLYAAHQQAQFEEYITEGEYGYAYQLYINTGSHKAKDAYLKESISSLTMAYAKEEISLEELDAHLWALSGFPSVMAEIENARLVAVELSNSHDAYKEGKATDDICKRLDVWRRIISLDTFYYAAVQRDVKDNEEAYIEALDKAIDHYSTRVRCFAEKYYEILMHWYPDSAEAQKWAMEYQYETSMKLSVYPLEINRIEITQDATGYWNLTIVWKNTSVKTIRTVRFSLVALNESGKIVTSKDTQGSWVVYDAQVYGPCEPQMKFEHSWSAAWYGPLVNKAELTGVAIEYAYGSEKYYTTEIDISNIMQLE